MTPVRRLTKDGLTKFAEFLASLKTDTPLPVPTNILIEHEMSESFAGGAVIEKRTFVDKQAFAEYIVGQMELAGITGYERDAGLWGWLSLYYFEQVCPRTKAGLFEPGQTARWIPTEKGFGAHRHLLAVPCRIYSYYRTQLDTARILLCGPVDSRGDIFEGLTYNQELFRNPTVVGAATLLYYDEKRSLPKVGASDKKGGSPGSFRRFTKLLNQLDVNWDAYSMKPAELLDVLPREFNRFRPKSLGT